MKKILGIALALSAATLAPAAFADSRPVELVVPFATGGSTDVYARFLAKELGAELKAPVVVVNRPGAGGGLGAAAVAHASPDGKTILLGTISTHAINPWIYKRLGYDANKDFVPVAKVVAMPNVLTVPTNSEVKSVDDLVNKAKTTDLTFGSAGGGTTSNLAGELMKQMKPEMKLTHVAYRGSAPATTDLMGGHIAFQFDNLTSLLSHIEAGRLRALAVSSLTPADQLPGVKPLSDQGFKGFELESWFGIFLPKGASSANVTQLTDALKKIYDKPEFIKQIKAAGVSPSLIYGADFEKFLRNEQNKWRDVVRKADIKLD
jgi:tripartite-type tricarboxylate transporter receptor subunit TctC